MAFASSSKDIRLDGTVLHANCLTKYGTERKPSSMDLDRVLGNIDGRFVWGAQSFGETARNIHLDGVILHAELKKGDGEFASTTFKLDDVITNEDGQLLAINFPAAIAVPHGRFAQQAVDQLATALNAKDRKISRANAGKETTVWAIEAVKDPKSSIFFKTFDFHTTQAFVRIIQYKEQQIHDVSADEIAVKTGAKAFYVENGGVAFAPYAGVHSHLPLVKAGDPILTIQVHDPKGKKPDGVLGTGSIDSRMDGCGMTIGRRVHARVTGGGIEVVPTPVFSERVQEYKEFFD